MCEIFWPPKLQKNYKSSFHPLHRRMNAIMLGTLPQYPRKEVYPKKKTHLYKTTTSTYISIIHINPSTSSLLKIRNQEFPTVTPIPQIQKQVLQKPVLSHTPDHQTHHKRLPKKTPPSLHPVPQTPHNPLRKNSQYNKSI